MKKLLPILFIVFLNFCLFFSCSPVSWQLIGNGEVMRSEYELNFTKTQFDSVCIADSLPNDLSLWLGNHNRDYETNNPMYRYMYIKRMDSLEVIYILDKDDNNYNITKRITE